MMLRRTIALAARFPTVQTRSYAGAEEGANSGKLILNFATPYEVFEKETEVESITVPAVEGRFGIFPNHVPIIAQLGPGIVDIKTKDKSTQYFIGTGFVAVHRSSRCEISVTEGFPVDRLDKSVAQAELEEAKKKVTEAKNDKERVEANIRVETFQAMVGTL